MRSGAREKTILKGWAEIAEFLGQPVATAQRWAKSGMPVRRSGRYVVGSREELTAWIAGESKQAIHIASRKMDLTADLRRGLMEARRRRKIRRLE